MQDVTALLLKWNGGDEIARESLIQELYGELNAIAGRYLGAERHVLEQEPHALVHEAYLKLIDMERIDWQNRAHFLAMAARVMRRILVDQARRRSAQKRDGGIQVTLAGTAGSQPDSKTDVLMLNAAMEKLASVDPDRARLVELRFFGGLTNDEAAEILGKSSRTVKRHWEVARGWLYRAMQANPGDGGL